MRLWPLFCVFACNPSPSGDTDTSPTDETPIPPEVTYTGDIQPLIASSCAGCHADGGIGPFKLDTYEGAKQMAPAALVAMQTRSMPPFLVTGDGTCNEWEHNQWLSEDQLQLMEAWIDQDYPEGDPTTPVEPTPPPSLPRVDFVAQTPDFTPEIVGGALAQFDEYRCFEVINPSTTDQYLTGYNVTPGNAAIVHHVIGYTVDMDGPSVAGRTNREQTEHLNTDGRDGWPCFSGAGEEIGRTSEPIAWAPGQGAVLFPEDTGIIIPAGESLVFQVHYNLVDPANIGTSDSSSIEMLLEPAVSKPAWTSLADKFLETLGGNPAVIPAGTSNHRYDYQLSGFELGAESANDTLTLRGITPHMHERGRKMWVTKIAADNVETCVTEVINWDFNWQKQYFFAQPITLSSGERIRVECEWDTSNDTEDVYPGWGTRNEMCLAGLYITRD